RGVDEDAFQLPTFADQGVDICRQPFKVSDLQRALRPNDCYLAIWEDFELEHRFSPSPGPRLARPCAATAQILRVAARAADRAASGAPATRWATEKARSGALR